jgi:hypothetical protein
MMEIAVNKATELGVPVTLNAPIQVMFAKAEGWVWKWLQDQTVGEEKVGVTDLGPYWGYSHIHFLFLHSLSPLLSLH